MVYSVLIKHSVSAVHPKNTFRFQAQWGTWGSMEYCPDGGFATSFSTRVEGKMGRKGDDTALNAICLTCNTGGQVCSKKGGWGDWKSSSTSNEGFYGADFSIEPYRGRKGDDTAGNALVLYGTNDEKYVTGQENLYGKWQGRLNCVKGDVICGLRTKVEDALGENRDDTALNGVELVCCGE